MEVRWQLTWILYIFFICGELSAALPRKGNTNYTSHANGTHAKNSKLQTKKWSPSTKPTKWVKGDKVKWENNQKAVPKVTYNYKNVRDTKLRWEATSTAPPPKWTKSVDVLRGKESTNPPDTRQDDGGKRKNYLCMDGSCHMEILLWAVKLNVPDQYYTQKHMDQVAEKVASDTGLVNKGQIGHLFGHYLFSHPYHESYSSTDSFQTKSSPSQSRKLLYYNLRETKYSQFKEHIHKVLDRHNDVEWYSQQVVRRRKKRSLTFNDPQFKAQWHLKNTLTPGMDINVTGVWSRNVTGHGVTVAVVDDGVEWSNPDLSLNYSPEGSWDFNDNDPDPMPKGDKVENHHGTRCAGEIAATANNNYCVVGVAYGAKVAGIRVLDGPLTDSLEASAFTKNMEINDVYSCSWGPDDDGKTVDGPQYLAMKALQHGVDYGRGGYGSIYVVASGNGGHFNDNCNFDGYANSIYTITIGAVDETGAMPYYAEECASMLAVTFSSGGAYQRRIVTTDWRKDGGTGCTDSHTGTSAAAPLAAAMVALMLEARSCLTWRDIQWIIAVTAVKVDRDLAHWTRNKAGLFHSHKHGFGLMNAWRLVNAAKVWESVPWLTMFTSGILMENKRFGAWRNKLVTSFEVSKERLDGYNLYLLEYVHVVITLKHPRRGNVEIFLQCPSGTESVLSSVRQYDSSQAGFLDWTFATVRCWAEDPYGRWTLTVRDRGRVGLAKNGLLKSWQLKLYGTPMTRDQYMDRVRRVTEAMSGEHLSSNHSRPCPPPPVVTHFIQPLSERVLKILLLVGAFCMLMAMYETLEYIFCYNEEKKEHRQHLLEQAAAATGSQSPATPPSPGGSGASEGTHLLGSPQEVIPLQLLPSGGRNGTNYTDSTSGGESATREGASSAKSLPYSGVIGCLKSMLPNKNNISHNTSRRSRTEQQNINPGGHMTAGPDLHMQDSGQKMTATRSSGATRSGLIDSSTESGFTESGCVPKEILDTLSPEEIRLNLSISNSQRSQSYK